ncbi:MAG: thermonuclease family protein, partial [Rhodospirillales bacterium]|nr:thermonuclease family protein [Rhodospirillales bacterium]
YGRWIGHCTVPNVFDQFGSPFKGKDLSQEMVASGWALAYRRYSDSYVGHEARAREQRAGMWSGSFVAPWKWRDRGT